MAHVRRCGCIDGNFRTERAGVGIVDAREDAQTVQIVDDREAAVADLGDVGSAVGMAGARIRD
jgi:hypothetical protein